MKILSVHDKEFAPYGKVIKGYDFTQLLEVLESTTERPTDGVIYVPSDDKLEATAVYAQLKDNFYGGMPIQIGYCNGTNNKLNCLEYHRDSEVNVAADEIVLLLAKLQDIHDSKIETSKVEAFTLPRGEAVQLFETTLHYAPASAKNSFRVVVVLPRGTNTQKPDIKILNDEDKMMTAKNKWLLAHPDTDEAKNGAVAGLLGENIEL